MNYLQLVNRLKGECGVSGADLTTLSGISGEMLRLARWINAAWIDLQAMHQDWEWMRSTATFPTVSGQPTYTPAQIGISDFGMWARDSFRNYANPPVTISIASPGVFTLTSHNLVVGDQVTPFTNGTLPTGLVAGTAYYVVSTAANTFTVSATAGGAAINTSGSQSGTHTLSSNNSVAFSGLATEIFMSYRGYDDWRNAYQYGALRQVQTRPSEVTITPAMAVGLGPFPVAGYTVIGDYYRIPSELVADTDAPSVTSQYHLTLVYMAMMHYGGYESASEVYSRGEANAAKWIRRLAADRLPEIMIGGALA